MQIHGVKDKFINNQDQGKEQGFVCDQEMCTSLLGHDKELILILGNVESCKKVLVKMNII